MFLYTEWCATHLIVWWCGSVKVCVVVERVEKLQDSLIAKLVLILIKRGGGEKRGRRGGRKLRRMKRGQGGRWWRSGKERERKRREVNIHSLDKEGAATCLL